MARSRACVPAMACSGASAPRRAGQPLPRAITGVCDAAANRLDGLEAYAAAAARLATSIPITFRRRLSALKANAFVSSIV